MKGAEKHVCKKVVPSENDEKQTQHNVSTRTEPGGEAGNQFTSIIYSPETRVQQVGVRATSSSASITGWMSESNM